MTLRRAVSLPALIDTPAPAAQSWTYFGGKNHLWQQIINLIPRHARFVEPFAGSAAVARHLRPAPEMVLIEKDKAQAWKLRKALAHCRVHCCDAVPWLEERLPAWDARTVVFADPPYPISDRRDPRARYACEMTDAEHTRLIKLLLAAPARVLVCGMPWGRYATAFASWTRHDFKVTLRSGNPGIESIWCNFRDAYPLHDYSQYGDDKQERQDVRRKVSRHLAKLRALDRHERAALLDAIGQAFPDAQQLLAGAL